MLRLHLEKTIVCASFKSLELHLRILSEALWRRAKTGTISYNFHLPSRSLEADGKEAN